MPVLSRRNSLRPDDSKRGRGEQEAPLCPARLILFCSNLFIGLIGSQLIPEWMEPNTYKTWKSVVKVVTMFCVSYIMIHVGFHFDIDKTQIRQYGTEYLVAMTAAGFPWILCAGWFIWALGEKHNLPWQEALIAARFAAPTSAGILFTMLEAAGMKETWIFQKARILAIFDDLDTLLLMVPLKAIYVGLKWELSIDLVFVSVLIILMWFFMHRLKLPVTWPMIVIYAVCVTVFCELIHFLTSSDLADPRDLAETVHLEVLLPSFTVGCMINYEHVAEEHEKAAQLEQSPGRTRRSLATMISADAIKTSLSAVFMVLVGFSMPPLFNDKHESGGHRRLKGNDNMMEPQTLALHVLACTFLMNFGKLFPATCYRSEATARTRIALAVAMMPRGEVCASIIVNALALGIEGPAMTIAVFCLACNMMMVSLFIFIVKKLTNDQVPADQVHSSAEDGKESADAQKCAEVGDGASDAHPAFSSRVDALEAVEWDEGRSI